MDTVHIFLQHYWWFIISLLGALLAAGVQVMIRS